MKSRNLSARKAYLSARVWGDNGHVFGIEEFALPFAYLEEGCWGRPSYFHDALDLFGFAFIGEQGISCEELCQQTAKGPHIDCRGVWNSQNYLWCTVKP